MNTLQFLQKILPEYGIHYLAIFKDGQHSPAHKAYADLPSMAAAIESYANSTTLSVYHACATYKAAVVETEIPDPENAGATKLRRQYRVPDNWDKAKAFWVDLDCGEEKHAEGKGYLTKRDAAEAVIQFCKDVGLGRPMFVDSGNGVHAYWPLTQDIGPNSWRKVATVLKAALAHAGVIADPSRTADFSSVLRPVGSFNRKRGERKPVVVASGAKDQDPKEFAGALQRWVIANNVTVRADFGAPKKKQSLNADLLAALPEFKHDPNHMADKCAQVSAMRDTKGDMAYESWRMVIGLLKFCEGGYETAREWSEARQETGHTRLDWDKKYTSWDAPPTLCESLEACEPSLCNGCQFKGKIKTPLVLGRIIPEVEEHTETIVDEEGAERTVAVPPLPVGYDYQKGMLCRLIPDREGVLQAFPFSTIQFYPTTRIRTDDGSYNYGMRMHLPNKTVRDFEMKAEAMASQTDMLRSLAKHELMQSNHKDAGTHMAAYLRDQLERLKREKDEINTLNSFGWKNDNTEFLLGDLLYLQDGTTRPVVLGNNTGRFAPAFRSPKDGGSLEGYAKGLNDLYNRKGMEHWQFAICCGWGALVAPFGEETFHGMMVALRGGDTGKGKTTVCYASLYAFGNPNDMILTGKEAATPNALWLQMGTFSNLPLLFDEFTNLEPARFSEVAYAVSNGREKSRLRATGQGVQFAATATWSMSPFVTGNIDFYGLLGASQDNSQAEAARLIQIDVDSYATTPLAHPEINRAGLSETERDALQAEDAVIVQNAIEQMKANRWYAGDAMVKYVVTHQKEVAKRVRREMAFFAKYLSHQKHRFFRNQAACAITMAEIAKELDIIQFDIDALRHFTGTAIQKAADSVESTNTIKIEDAFSRMVSSIMGRMLVTQEFRDKRHKDGPETIRTKIIGDISGRYVLGTSSRPEFAKTMFINHKEMRDWCTKNRVDMTALLNNLETRGALIDKSEKITVTRGTDLPSFQARCVVVNADKMDVAEVVKLSTEDDDSV